MKIQGVEIAAVGLWKLRLLEGRLIHQHDGDVVFHWVDAMALGTLQTLGLLAIFERLLARRADQNFQQILGNHDEGNCTTIGASSHHGGTETT